MAISFAAVKQVYLLTFANTLAQIARFANYMGEL
jgi:hypothetical protein